ncbi:RagB/SusD family nutrient uptake outer membrane protein [Hymenobacter cellulosilyticus]|uniref:RagB/SusD family nutrient uptake outer membrane protein n=1 Tax=Hymenobacter cellulosilyticus TaxID=2932248 RepID=A0A8T9Q1I3_9BACT|nr:RagB/SusD family nutrient uptake outer membrane protein [Hymenobacter cellulosilyticus]UOQ70291.1 RagB/SusD family nutrient uptake outer membrane protein [Hymenobacter cellulosilyticus]
MKKTFVRRFATLAVASSLLGAATTSCVGDLDRDPFNEVTSDVVYSDPANYKPILAKLYAGLALSGQTGPSGKPDLSGVDEGFSNYIRQYWSIQELPTDEAVIAWGDDGLQDYHLMNWTANNPFIRSMYNRIFYQITACNEYIRETKDDKLSSRNITGANLASIKNYRAEARFLRALSYYHALDLFGKPPFADENDQIGNFTPRQISRAELFNYIESELKAIETELVDARQNEYARVDKAAAWMLLAKLYLNAEVYTGTARNTDAVTYASKVIGAGYTLQTAATAKSSAYGRNFLADNNTSPEMIFPVAFDGDFTKGYGGTTFIIHASVGGDMPAAAFGVDGGWGGTRTTRALFNLFPDTAADRRGRFFTKGQNLDINNLTEFKDGLGVVKFKNVKSDGTVGKNLVFPDTDFPMFRLADAYLMYAEAVLRGGTGGSRAQALTYINALRSRAFANGGGTISDAQLTLDFILDERGRELHWEGHRRTDLIRFKKFTTASYLWPWKGGVKEGRAVSENLNVFPIPSTDLVANPNLTQNTGY